MNIAVLGTGRVGTTLGRRWAQAGHHVVFGSRDPQATKVRDLVVQLEAAAPGRVSATTSVAAVAQAEVVLLAVPYGSLSSLLPTLGDLGSRVLIECSNPLQPDLSGLLVGHSTSAAEQVAGWAQGGRVVKAFNTASTATMANALFDGQRAAMFYCGDDGAAKEIVRGLISELDFEAVDAGRLAHARYLEPLAMLYIHLAVRGGWGSQCAFRMIRR